MKKIVFIINSAQNQRCIKRVNEFVEQGYRVSAYAFSREVEMRNTPNFELNLIGHYKNDVPYYKRVLMIMRAVRRILNQYKKQDVVYYLFGLDIAMAFLLQSKRPYIFEESDLAHTYIHSKAVRNTFEWIDKYIIRHSLLTVFTSEGFAQYHFGDSKLENTFIIPNRLTPEITKLPWVEKRSSGKSALNIGFVGGLRFESIARFAYFFVKNFPMYQFHFFGSIDLTQKQRFAPLETYSNCHFHGAFKNPDDLAEIYSQIDLVLSTYDVKYDNVKYAEPNKLYEAVYFETPIIVSKGTFLADKTLKLGIGYEVDPLNENEVVEFVNGLTPESLENCRQQARALGKEWALNINTAFFEKLSSLM